jgi:6-phosphogluconolactonase/glucosamine-6-phosphate isomerase/deaminase
MWAAANHGERRYGMLNEYRDGAGNRMSREQVQRLIPQELAERSGKNLVIYGSHELLYDALAEIMMELVKAARGRPTTLILPVGPTLHYAVFARKAAESGIDLSRLRTFNMDEFLDRTGRTVDKRHPLSFRGEMMRKLFDHLPADKPGLRRSGPEGVDLCIAGVGPEGHFALNEDPNSRHVRVSEEEFIAACTRCRLRSPSIFRPECK